MHIAIDLQACQSGSRLGGIGRYSLALAKSIVKCRGDHRVTLVLNQAFPKHEFDLRMEFAEILDPQSIVAFHCPTPVAAKDGRNHARKQVAEKLRASFIAGLNPDVLHVSSLVEGWGDDVVTSVDDFGLASRTAVTWYDLIPFVAPEMYLNDPDIAAHYYQKVDQAKRAGLLLGISQFSSQEAQELLGLEPHRVVNISSAAGPEFAPRNVPDSEAAELNQQLGIDRPFLMFTGSFDARKNQASLIKAFAKLPVAIRDRYQLVLAGNGWPGVYDELKGVARQAGLTGSSVVFTGHISDDQLLSLYNLCHLFVFPSLREGFGLPALEAMACGTPAIGSNCTSVPEVIGRADALFDPNSIDSISGKICQVLSDENFRQGLIQHGLEHAKKFSWDASARRAIEGFEALHDRNTTKSTPRLFVTDNSLSKSKPYADSGYEHLIQSVTAVAKQHRFSEQELVEVAQLIERNEETLAHTQNVGTNRTRIGWVTSWKARCGIASYSDALVGSSPNPVSAVFAEKNCCAPTTSDSGGTTVVPCWSAGNTDNLSELAGQLDRHKIDVVVIQFNYGFFNFNALNQLIAAQVAAGRRVIITLHSTTDAGGKRLSSLRSALLACERVLVHAKKDVDVLESIGVTRNVSLFPHGIVDIASLSNRTRGLPDLSRKCVIASYGFFLAHKGLLELVQAFARLSIKDPSLHLLMVNAMYSPEASEETISRVRREIATRGLKDRVTMVTDYLDEDESLGLLARAKLVVFPYQQTGESSSAAVRMGIASGRPVAVTPLSIFDDVSNVVLQLPGTSDSDLASGIGALVDRINTGSDVEIDALARRASEWRALRSTKVIARQLSHLAVTAKRLSPVAA